MGLPAEVKGEGGGKVKFQRYPRQIILSSEEIAKCKEMNVKPSVFINIAMKYCLGYPVHAKQIVGNEFYCTISKNGTMGDVPCNMSFTYFPETKKLREERKVTAFARLCLRYCLGLPIPEEWLPLTRLFRTPVVSDERCKFLRGKKRLKCNAKRNKPNCPSCIHYEPVLRA